jgi:transposase-like protein
VVDGRGSRQTLSVPDAHTRLGIRDRAILALLVACGLRRDELARLEVRHLQLRDERWVLLDLQGKGRRVRTVPVPLWVKRLLDRWLDESGIREGPLFRTLRKGGRLDPEAKPVSEDLIYTLVRKAGAAIGHPELTPHDLRRTCAKLCRKAGGDLEQIQLLLGACQYSDDRTISGNEAGSGASRQRSSQNPRRLELQLIVTDGCPGLAAALQVVYPRVLHQRCWVHKMRNILEKVRKRDYDAVKADAQAIYQSDSRANARHAFLRFRKRWNPEYPVMVRQLERDLPELLAFYSFPKPLWRKLRTTNLIERVFVEVRRRTRPMVCFVNVASVDRIIYSIFQRFNLEWRNRTLRVFTQAA